MLYIFPATKIPMDTRDDFHERLATNALRRARAEALENEITELAAHLNAATYRLLTLIRELDGCEPWGNWGFHSCAHWLNWKCGIGIVAAREKVRVALALGSLPLISEAFRQGEVSYSKVRAMTRVATPENEDYLLMIAQHGTAAHVEKLVRAYRGVQRTEELERANRQDEERELTYYHDEEGALIIKARLPAETGAVVLKGLEAAADSLRRSAGADEELSTGDDSAEAPATVRMDFESRCRLRADALVLMAETLLEHGLKPSAGGDRHQVIVHVAQEALADDEDGVCELEDGPSIAAETARRIACDASVVRMVEDEEGNPLDIGRKTRAIPPAMRRALAARDGGCRFPGCTHRRFVDAHHIEHWARGGETKLGNLVQLCRWHHRLVHEGGFGVTAHESGTLTFTRPDGLPLHEHPGGAISGSLQAMQRLNEEAGLSIDDQTGVSLWDGVHMDYAMAVEGLLWADARLEYRPAPRLG